jgi:hypothetical protein
LTLPLIWAKTLAMKKTKRIPTRIRTQELSKAKAKKCFKHLRKSWMDIFTAGMIIQDSGQDNAMECYRHLTAACDRVGRAMVELESKFPELEIKPPKRIRRVA